MYLWGVVGMCYCTITIEDFTTFRVVLSMYFFYHKGGGQEGEGGKV